MRAALVAVALAFAVPVEAQSIARQWNEEALGAIRRDLARPTIHARNLFHLSVAMWDAWAAYDRVAGTYLHHERGSASDVARARAEAISFAAYRILTARFADSPGAEESQAAFDARMARLGYDPGRTSLAEGSPASLGNRVAATVLAFGAQDGSNEADGYRNRHYAPVNPPLSPNLPGNPSMVDPNRWQPLALQTFIDQAGNLVAGGSRDFLSPEWGQVAPFALGPGELAVYPHEGYDYWVYHDPGRRRCSGRTRRPTTNGASSWSRSGPATSTQATASCGTSRRGRSATRRSRIRPTTSPSTTSRRAATGGPVTP
jgi:hypothetical protein